MKKVLFCVILIIVIVAGVLIAVNYNDNNKTTSTSQGNISADKVNDITKNNETANNNSAEENNVIDNEVVENSTEPNATDDNNTGKTDEEKAIDIVKKEWGADNTVSFTYEGTENGELIVAVRDASTTRVYKWYLVNLESNTCRAR